MTASSIHAQILGAVYGSLPLPLQRIHDARALKRLAGRCRIRGSRGRLARMLSRIVSDGRYSFDVRAQVAGIGLLVHYQGWLSEHAG